MVGLLIRMKVASLRHTLRGGAALLALSGGALAVALTASTLGEATGSGELLAAKFATWTLAWLLGAFFLGGDEATLPLAYFRLLGVPPRRLALGLLGAALVGVGPLLNLIVFAGLLLYAAGLGPAATIIAIPATLLQLLALTLLARLMADATGTVIRSRAQAIVAATISAVLTALGASGWVFAPALHQLRAGEFGPHLGLILRALPTGWGIVAVDAARAGNWPLALGALGGLVALVAGALAAWGALLGRRGATRPASPAVGARGGDFRALVPGPVGAVAARELRAWWRDLTRITYLWFALVYGLTTCLLPLVDGWAGLLPWTGALVLLMGAAVSANLYGAEGSALWLTLLTPGALRADVRGRQLAWTLTTAPVALVLTLVLAAASGQADAWPRVLAAVPALIGGTTGLLPLLAVLNPTPLRDPGRRGGSLTDNGIDSVQVILMLLLGAVATAPALLVVVAGERLGSPALRWAGVPLGIATGAVWAWAGGRLAAARLDARGPELLAALRRGLPARTATWGRPSSPVAARSAPAPVPRAAGLPKRAQLALLAALWLLGFAGIFEGINALARLATGADPRRWFIPIVQLVPSPYWLAASVASLVVGIVACAIFTWLMRRDGPADRVWRMAPGR